MSGPTAWTYEQVTEAAQHRIRTILQPRSRGTHQEEGDAEPMERLAKGEVR